MAKIARLSSNLIDKIAAGEVVERPSSVVKELVENAIDAGASKITVEIENGGTTLIRVTDNGSGLERIYAKEAFLRHATSKITNLTDLENIMTLGFRGEALSSISSVSQTELITKTEQDETGIKILVEGGEVISEQETGCTTGTVMTVRNLFYNTPARRKFLKRPPVESGYISDIVSKLILANPEISFGYINNGTEMLSSVGNGDVKAAVMAVYGRNVAAGMLELKSKKDGLELNGYIGKPELCRANRSYGHFFLNGRYIVSGLVQSAVEEAYKTRLLSGKFPVYALYMKTDPQNVDVNVHPTKLEVRFADEELIYETVKGAVEKVLSKAMLIPSATLEAKRGKFSDAAGVEPMSEDRESPALTFDAVYTAENVQAYQAEDETPSLKYISYTLPGVEKDAAENEKDGEDGFEELKATRQDSEEEKRLYKDNPVKAGEKTASAVYTKPAFAVDYKICGQAFGTYWFIEKDGSLFIIDQHAAHERVLYEELTRKYRSEELVSQRLLTSIALNLTEREYNTVTENMELLESMGFELEDFGGSCYALRSVPYVIGNMTGAAFFTEIIDRLTSVGSDVKDVYDVKTDIIASQACKAAVKANDRLSYSEAKELISRLMQLENPFCCPHGRPTVIELTKYEIEKKFKRIQ